MLTGQSSPVMVVEEDDAASAAAPAALAEAAEDDGEGEEEDAGLDWEDGTLDQLRQSAPVQTLHGLPSGPCEWKDSKDESAEEDNWEMIRLELRTRTVPGGRSGCGLGIEGGCDAALVTVAFLRTPSRVVPPVPPSFARSPTRQYGGLDASQSSLRRSYSNKLSSTNSAVNSEHFVDRIFFCFWLGLRFKGF